MFDQPFVALASRWRQEFLFHVSVKIPLAVDRQIRPASSCWLRIVGCVIVEEVLAAM